MTRYISDDTARCAGRFGLADEDQLCPRRLQCPRFIALVEWPDDEPIPFRIPVHTGLCADGTDWMIGGEACPARAATTAGRSSIRAPAGG